MEIGWFFYPAAAGTENAEAEYDANCYLLFICTPYSQYLAEYVAYDTE